MVNDIMSHLNIEEQSKVIAHLCEGCSIRSVERLLGFHRDTIMRLGVKVGEGCAVLHGKYMKNLNIARIEMDEEWSFVKKKRRNVGEADGDQVGDQYVFLAMDAVGKGIISWFVGKRTAQSTEQLVADVKRRVMNNPDFSTDGYAPYVRAIDDAFDGAAAHGIVDKQTVIIAKDGDKGKYYAKEKLTQIVKTAVNGNPTVISTSYIERQNLTSRMSQRRLMRETNGHSKKYENHCAAIALYVMHYNFCRVHSTLRITPAMQLGLADHVWTVTELIEAALSREVQHRVRLQKAGLRVIEGGRGE